MKQPERFRPEELVEWLVHEASLPAVSEVCTMRGKSYGECWGCPVLECPRRLAPLAYVAEDRAVLDRVIEKLKSNKYWIGNKSGSKLWARLVESLGGEEDVARQHLWGLFLLSLGDYTVNLAVEAVTLGQATIEEAAARVGFLHKGNDRDRNVNVFKQKVEQKLSDTGYVAPGRQFHSRPMIGQEYDEGVQPSERNGLRNEPTMGLRNDVVSRTVRLTDGRTRSFEGALTWDEYTARRAA